LNRHPKPAETRPAAVALIPDNRPDQARGEQRLKHGSKTHMEIVSRKRSSIGKRSGWREHKINQIPHPNHNSSRDNQFSDQEGPVPHSLLDTCGRFKFRNLPSVLHDSKQPSELAPAGTKITTFLRRREFIHAPNCLQEAVIAGHDEAMVDEAAGLWIKN
jgi:hypothetical protein